MNNYKFHERLEDDESDRHIEARDLKILVLNMKNREG